MGTIPTNQAYSIKENLPSTFMEFTVITISCAKHTISYTFARMICNLHITWFQYNLSHIYMFYAFHGNLNYRQLNKVVYT